MAHSVVMPELGESVTEGTITTWLKSVGDTIEADEALLEVSTDKVDTEVPSPVSGVLLEIRAEEDDTVDVGDVIAIIGEEGESADSGDSAKEEEAPAESDDDSAEEKEEPKAEKKSSGSGKATDVAMPELGESVTEGTITTWLKKVGDTVEVDEALLEVSTDKVDTEVPSPVAGTILEILADEDDTVDVGDVIVRIGDPDAADAGEDKEEKKEEPKDEPKAEEKKEEPKAKKSSGSGKATDVVMPELGESVTEGTITSWLKSVGDTIEADEALLEVSTDKVDTEVPSPVAGTILEILAEEDDTVDVGDVIARIGDADAAASDDTDGEEEEQAAADDSKDEPKTDDPMNVQPKDEDDKEPTEEEKSKAGIESAAESRKADEGTTPSEVTAEKSSDEPKVSEGSSKVDNGSGNMPYVTPLVRKLADKHGVDLTKVEGTGVGGRIRKQDVLAAAGEGDAPASVSSATGDARANWSTKSVDPEKAELIGTTAKVNRIREITAAKMVEALQISAQLTHLQEVDVTRVAELRKANKPAFQDKHGVNLTYLPFFVKATVEALVSHPNVNASYNAETKEMTYHADVNVAIAVDTERGLLTPVIHKAQDLSLVEIAQAIADLADRARNNKLKPNDLTGATFTITNIGSEGALSDTPVLVPPQAGILGTGAIQKRPVVVTENGADAIAIRQMCYIPFTYDHQIVDGADAGRFTATIKDRLETAAFEDELEV